VSFLEQLYRDAVLDHARRPRNFGPLDPVTISQEGLNPSCGDELEIHLHIERADDHDVVRAASFTGQGCAISQASASMMTEVVRGTSATQARELVKRFKAMIHGSGADPALGDAAVLEGVSKLHARVKCATLAWITLDEALVRWSATAQRGPSDASSPVDDTSRAASAPLAPSAPPDGSDVT
jgi:nitrogen fixation protein NifU and related proteins